MERERGNDIKDLLQALELSGARTSHGDVNELAHQISGRLNLENLDVSAFAQRMAEMTLRARDSVAVPQKQQKLTSTTTSSDNNGDSFRSVPLQRSPQSRGRSPSRSYVRSQTNNVRSLSASNETATNRGTPVRNYWGSGSNNKIPPATGGTKSSWFLRSGAQNSPQTEEKKDELKSSRHGLHPSRDESPGASPTRRQNQFSQQQQQQQNHSRIRERSPGATPTRPNSNRAASPMQHQGSYFPQPPQHSFQPSSPVLPPVASRPSTPVTNRPPSRCSSPYSARPGLQEDDDGDDSVVSISARSPVRSYLSGNVSSSGISSCQQQPSAGIPVVGHCRSGSIDTDVVKKPVPPRATSHSPIRRRDDDGGLQPAPPRGYSRSPMGRPWISSETSNQAPEQQNICTPDLSIPDFNPPFDRPSSGGRMFTPPPRAVPSPRIPISGNVDNNNNYDDDESPPTKRKNDLKTPYPYTSTSLHPRPSLSPNGHFQFGDAPVPPKSRRDLMRERLKKSTDESYSPMDIDEPTPIKDTFQPPPGDVTFNMGTAPAPEMRRPRPRRAILATENRPNHTIETNAQESETETSTSFIKNTHIAVPQVDFSGKIAFIHGKREEGKTFYMSGDFRSSIVAYTDAIRVFQEGPGCLPSDTLAVLKSNRAAALLMVGALKAAVMDCQDALNYVTVPRSNEPFSNDSGLLLKMKLHVRLARGFVRMGDHQAALNSFSCALSTGNEATAFSKTRHKPQDFMQHQETITQMITEATLGQGDAKRLENASDRLAKCRIENLKNLSERNKYAEILNHVNVALAIASGCDSLISKKVDVLVQMKRWREVAGYLERLAACNANMEGVFVEDLASTNPFPGIPPLHTLKALFFGGARDEDPTTMELKLNSKASGEAVLRLPYSLTSIYIRALRLEERYQPAEAALEALQDLVRRGTGMHEFHFLQRQFGFITTEKSKLTRTKEGREKGDVLFRTSEFDLAAATYGQCLKIDGEGVEDTHDGATAGGRLHAVLHCNRAACLMALRRFAGAVEECTAALKIHSRYMKAILRRARCYTRLQQTLEAIAEYKRWFDLVEDAKKWKHIPSSPCLFDGPNEVKDDEVTRTQKEYNEIREAQRRAESNARNNSNGSTRRSDRSNERFHDHGTSSWRTSNEAGQSANQRREKYWQQSSSRHWDSFTNRGPRSSSNPRNNQDGNGDRSKTRSSSQGRPRQGLVSPRSDSDADHYNILNIPPNATIEEIKRSFRKLALKYHPDKNQGDEGSKDNFLRVKLAHEVLCDPVKRREYDADLRLSGRRPN